MDKLIRQEDIEICKGCKEERDEDAQNYEWVCQNCGRDSDTFQDAVKIYYSKIMLKD